MDRSSGVSGDGRKGWMGWSAFGWGGKVDWMRMRWDRTGWNEVGRGGIRCRSGGVG